LSRDENKIAALVAFAPDKNLLTATLIDPNHNTDLGFYGWSVDSGNRSVTLYLSGGSVADIKAVDWDPKNQT
jgi:hypothetical protein